MSVLVAELFDDDARERIVAVIRAELDKLNTVSTTFDVILDRAVYAFKELPKGGLLGAELERVQEIITGKLITDMNKAWPMEGNDNA